MYGLRFVTQLSRAQRTGTTEFTKSMSVSELPQRIQCIETVIKSAHSTDTWHREDDDPNAIPDGGACHTSQGLESVNASLFEVREGTVSSDIAPGRAMTAPTAVNASRDCERQLRPQACLQQAAAHSASLSVQRTRRHRLVTLCLL